MMEVYLKIFEFEKEYGISMPLYLHGGESMNSLFNTNLFDNILLKYIVDNLSF